ncbi:MAG: DUF3710 domain-containing protein [Micrococcus sp.]|nr:DUF3710 domain-containing protein [Micrococcus sp.]
MIFGRNRTVRHEHITLPEELMEDRDRIAAGLEPRTEATQGPFDATDRTSTAGYVDLGAVRVRAVQGMTLRLDLEDSTKRIIAVTLALGSSALQLQAFAAPRRGGLWEDLRAEIMDALGTTEGAAVSEQTGPFGTEILSRLPASLPDGSPGYSVARFVGVDGPRWFLRGVIQGEAALGRGEVAEQIEALFRDTVVVRGDEPKPPRELLDLRAPADARPVRRRRPGAAEGAASEGATAGAAAEQGTGHENQNTGSAPGDELPERGPEMTEVR